MLPNKTDLFVNRLKKAMDLRGMSQIELARETNLQKQKINQYVNGMYEPKIDALYLIARALNVSEIWLIGYDVSMERNNNGKAKEKGLLDSIKNLYGKEAVELLKYFADLNKTGKYEAVKRVSELREVTKYTETQTGKRGEQWRKTA